MDTTEWILLDTETTGLSAPIYVVELAAQCMRGWQPVGPPFRRLLNQNADIPPEAARVHVYTREILDRDGGPAPEVYREFADYVQGRPLVAFNLSYDLDEVLWPEWARLGVAPIGSAGFCALRLAQRLLDPVPAGNCKLQTLRQFYRLPERGAHTALGDVTTVVDLLGQVLRPLAERLGLKTWAQLTAYAAAPWFPSRIAFGKYKGRLFQEARGDTALRGWLNWLAGSANTQTAEMGAWYLAQIAAPAHAAANPGTEVMIFSDPAVAALKILIAAARAQLAEVEAQYTSERHAVEVTQAVLFGLLHAHYQQRDRLQLVVTYRQKYLAVVVRVGEEEAETVVEQYKEAKQRAANEYAEGAAQAAGRKNLSETQTLELQALWKKLVCLYHPDRFATDPEKLASYTQLTSAINSARDSGDLDQLREIANDPSGYLQKRGLGALNFGDAEELSSLNKLLDTLRLEIVATLEATNQLRKDPRYELHVLATKQPGYLEEVARDILDRLEKEIAKLRTQALQLEEEIHALVGGGGPAE